MIAALYVQTSGCYFGLPDVDPWDEARDARKYAGPYPVVAHPPCERWGRYWWGGPNWRGKPRLKLGDDGGCFDAALHAVRTYGGVLEHPAESKAWAAFGLRRPMAGTGWAHDLWGGASCVVEQGHYGHRARKVSWLYAVGVELPELEFGPSVALLRGTTRRTGAVAMMSHRERSATPPAFRDLLLSMARSVGDRRAA